MWTNIKLLFNKTGSFDKKLSVDFDKQVKKAIYVFENSEEINTDEDVIKHLTMNEIGHLEAVEILLFLPIAFVRQWLPTVKWLDTYIELINAKKNVTKKYAKTKSYQIIWEVTTAYFKEKPNKDTIIKIGARSAEFHAINKLFLDNPNSKLEDIQLTPTVLIRS